MSVLTPPPAKPQNFCPVCGYIEDSGRPLCWDETCRCCGTTFPKRVGRVPVEALRREWILGGMVFWDRGHEPREFEPTEQLKRVQRRRRC